MNAALDARMTAGGAVRAQTRRGPTNTGFGVYPQPTLVAFDPVDQDTLVAGAADSGVFLSADGGASWQIVTDNSGTQGRPVIPRPWFAHFDREGDRSIVYLGTQGRGVWKLSYQRPTDELCVARCEAALDLCMENAGQKGSPTKAQCLQTFNRCRARCSP